MRIKYGDAVRGLAIHPTSAQQIVWWGFSSLVASSLALPDQLNWNLISSYTLRDFFGGDRKPSALGNPDWRWRPWETCREHHLQEAGTFFLMLRNSSRPPNVSYPFKPLWLCMCVPCPSSLKCQSSHSIPWLAKSYTTLATILFLYWEL